MYVVPFLIVGITPVTNVRVQKTRNIQSKVIHVDRLKVYRGETPKSWLPANKDDEDTVTVSGEETVVEAIRDDNTVEGQPDEMAEQSADQQPEDADLNDDQQRPMDSTEGTSEEHPIDGT